jgi:acyl-coenzyme A thioesterase PaaI-like protein
LVHGGFVFSAMDYAAMLAVNEATTVLGESKLRFLAPVRVGQDVMLHARRIRIEGKKHIVEVEARCVGVVVAAGEFVCFVPRRHVLQGE